MLYIYPKMRNMAGWGWPCHLWGIKTYLQFHQPSAGLQYLQCVSNGGAAALYSTVNACPLIAMFAPILAVLMINDCPSGDKCVFSLFFFVFFLYYYFAIKTVSHVMDVLNAQNISKDDKYGRLVMVMAFRRVKTLSIIPSVGCGTAVSPVRQQWRCSSLALDCRWVSFYCYVHLYTSRIIDKCLPLRRLQFLLL